MSPAKKRSDKAKAAPNETIASRLAHFRERMGKDGAPACLISNRVDQIYLTGFTGEDGSVLITPRQVFLLTDGRFDENADIEAPWARKVLRKKTMIDELRKIVGRLKLPRVVVQADHLSLAQSQEIRKAIRPARLTAGKPIVNRMRLTKDATELAQIRRAIEIAQTAFERAVRQISAGQTERELAARLEYEMQVLGATGASFPTIVAEGPNASLPHAVPGERRIVPGCGVLVDWGARVGQYCSDLTRVVFINSVSPVIEKIYRITLEAQLKAIEAIKPGRRMCDVDAVARRHIKAAGYGKNFGHGLGHGLGMDVHEAPRLNHLTKDKMEPGMVVTVEPGIYLPGTGGVRVEDDVLVTDEGHEVLSSLPKRLEQMVYHLVS